MNTCMLQHYNVCFSHVWLKKNNGDNLQYETYTRQGINNEKLFLLNMWHILWNSNNFIGSYKNKTCFSQETKIFASKISYKQNNVPGKIFKIEGWLVIKQYSLRYSRPESAS